MSEKKQVLITTLKTKLPALDLLSWLKAQDAPTKFYLKFRDNDEEWAGFGNLFESPKALVPTLDWALEDYENFLREENLSNHLFVVNTFDLNPHKTRAILPRFEISKQNAEYVLKINLWNNERAEEFDQSMTVGLPPITEETPNELLSKNLSPTQEEWPNYFASAKEQFSYLKKIVLARKTQSKFKNQIDPYLLLKKLDQPSYKCFFQLDNEIQVVSVSPERLFSAMGTSITTEAVAGTRPRGTDQHTDAQFESELKSSPKDQNEHQLVVDHIYQVLQNHSSQIQVDPIQIAKLKKVQHLKSTIQAELFQNVFYSEILKELHPTAAIGGLPKTQALNWLEKNEPFQRDYYAAPIGVLAKNCCEFFVNIRSAQIQKNEIKIYAGVGVVPESTAQAEWDEMAIKEQQFWDAL